MFSILRKRGYEKSPNGYIFKKYEGFFASLSFRGKNDALSAIVLNFKDYDNRTEKKRKGRSWIHNYSPERGHLIYSKKRWTEVLRAIGKNKSIDKEQIKEFEDDVRVLIKWEEIE